MPDEPGVFVLSTHGVTLGSTGVVQQFAHHEQEEQEDEHAFLSDNSGASVSKANNSRCIDVVI